mmetsp:Transcript_51580/g.110196  ORF Transcript_51580/g.110196 Transcript_51580/m.110196 type:complete len:99 (+) Transcript_51580:176-472(+)
MLPDLAPDAMFCICCAFFAFGHKDVRAKKKKEATRADKIEPHMNAAHDRAVAKWQEKYGPLSGEVQPAVEVSPSREVSFVEPPLASLVRTCHIIVALT